MTGPVVLTLKYSLQNESLGRHILANYCPNKMFIKMIAVSVKLLTFVANRVIVNIWYISQLSVTAGFSMDFNEP